MATKFHSFERRNPRPQAAYHVVVEANPALFPSSFVMSSDRDVIRFPMEERPSLVVTGYEAIGLLPRFFLPGQPVIWAQPSGETTFWSGAPDQGVFSIRDLATLDLVPGELNLLSHPTSVLTSNVLLQSAWRPELGLADVVLVTGPSETLHYQVVLRESVDSGSMEDPAVAIATEKGRERFVARLYAFIIETPVEDGLSHPVENELKELLGSRQDDAAKWIQSLFESTEEIVSHAAVLVCLGRLPRALTSPWGIRIARQALTSKEVELRHAAVRALELWGGIEATAALDGHTDAEPWLDDYARRVARDLRSSISMA